jgi:hypothetical protein
MIKNYQTITLGNRDKNSLVNVDNWRESRGAPLGLPPHLGERGGHPRNYLKYIARRLLENRFLFHIVEGEPGCWNQDVHHALKKLRGFPASGPLRGTAGQKGFLKFCLFFKND